MQYDLFKMLEKIISVGYFITLSLLHFQLTFKIIQGGQKRKKLQKSNHVGNEKSSLEIRSIFHNFLRAFFW